MSDRIEIKFHPDPESDKTTLWHKISARTWVLILLIFALSVYLANRFII